jgi:pimeloyl-ACP methyl ester carboxylesterase
MRRLFYSCTGFRLAIANPEKLQGMIIQNAVAHDQGLSSLWNTASYPRWQEWLRVHQPRLLVVWGKYDPSFTVAGAEAYKQDVPGAEVVLLEAGHFALDEANGEIASLILAFLGKR